MGCFLCWVCISQVTVGIIEKWGQFVKLAELGLHFVNPYVGEWIAGTLSTQCQYLDVRVETKRKDSKGALKIMAFNSFPLSYKSLQENISSMYKNMHTFSFRKFEEETPEQRLAHQQTENLKWQQDMFHGILNKIGLHKEGIVSEEEVGALRSDLLYSLIASPAEGEWPAITRDKLLFLQF